jgi:hypothetical protein
MLGARPTFSWERTKRARNKHARKGLSVFPAERIVRNHPCARQSGVLKALKALGRLTRIHALIVSRWWWGTNAERVCSHLQLAQ